MRDYIAYNTNTKFRFHIRGLKLQRLEVRGLTPAGADLEGLQSRRLMEEDK